jgi:L-ascorbate metabolism protein UlaG (beta-lactamase superfamily)
MKDQRIAIVLINLLAGVIMSISQIPFEQDTIQTNQGALVITFIGHGTLMFAFNKMVIQVDPVSEYADYSTLPKADLILITHHHGDHLDPVAIEKLSQPGTEIILTETCAQQLKKGIVLKNGEVKKIKGLTIEAVPAYNLVHKRDNGKPFHPKGEGNGYVITFGDKKVYVAGDTENIPEMSNLKGIDVAFLPMNLPYTMTPEMVAEAVKAFKPKILYPYHYGDTDVNQLLKLMKDFPETEVRIRKMQ